jgi:hypothetical protein
MAETRDKSPALVASTFTTFLESCAPNVRREVSDVAFVNSLNRLVLAEPDILLHCSTPLCDGLRKFHCTSDTAYISKGWNFKFIVYVCRNCETTTKTFALAVNSAGGASGQVEKFGEIPTFGPPTPARFIKLVGPDRELFLKGRRAEIQGLGIGAFVYYRRVVERQKGRIIEEIGRVAKNLGATAATLKLFDEAAKETQFTKAVELIKSAIPESIRINGHNPLTLLHSTLSQGIHDKTDDQCLALATSVRVLLNELSERLSQLLKDDAELQKALKHLLNPNTDDS